MITVPAGEPSWRAVVLVEGESDQAALETLARRRGRVLAADGASIVAMGGATNLRAYLRRYGPEGLDLRLAGLYDASATGYVRASLERAGLGSGLSPVTVRDLGFHACDRDLEDELIRALGTDTVEEIIDSEGELGSLRRLQQQPAQADRSTLDHLRRFMGSKSRRKLRYARLMVAALDLDRVPPALDSVLDAV